MMRNMKDSGIEWIGSIPSAWGVRRINTLYTPRNTKVNDDDYPPLSVTMKGILPQLENVAKTDDHSNRKLVKKGDFVINSRSDRRGSCGISKYNGSVSLINTVLKPFQNISPSYYDWLFHTSLFADEFYKWGHGIVDDLWSTNWQNMRSIFVTYPSVKEQKQIADFLDHKCSEIDALRLEIEKEIATLKEYKKSIITEAVTKGLNKNVPMKDSGIEWIGKIPKEWKIVRVKDGFYRKNKKAHQTNPTVLSLARNGVKIRDISTNEGQLAADYSNYNPVDIDDILINPMDLVSGDNCSISRVRGVISPAYVNLRYRQNINPKFYNYYFKIQYWLGAFFAYGSGVSFKNRWTLSFETINKFPLVLLSPDEQKQIADFLDRKCSEIDDIIEAKNKQLSTLDEYKKSLIYEYVTGKKEVPSV